ncbi:LUD domain-containing protein [Grimontia kaedaensis]|uniref:LUD domain-containing protein n=1 Tax=Grimontia kaedaensis TaxID=2872157 RepID=A0ABY4WYD9_9GAMM|nr:LUD domain-containing protein [Grimontia kaedaensis]USH03989.1 LUD domain-containing protein [Grimontia kaedaensis]
MKAQSQEARAAIFAKLNAAPRAPKSNELPVWQAWSSENSQTRVERLLGCMKASHTEIIHTEKGSIETTLTQCIQSNGLGKVLFTKNSPLAEVVVSQCPGTVALKYDQTMETLKTTLFQEVDASVNVIKAAIGDTGTLAIVTGEDEPRALSLVPPVHIAILHESDIVSNFSELMASTFWKEAGWETQPPTNLVLVSGPSKTADIQQTLAYGAHGPKRLILILVKE